MEFRSGGGQEEETGMPVPPGFSSPPMRLSAFSKPTLPPTSSLVFSPRGLDGGATRNETFFEAKFVAPVNPENHSLNSRGVDSDPAPVGISSPGATGGGGGGSSLRASTSTSAPAGAARTPSTAVRYRECLRNHAASVGGHVVDGCGEFMPGGEAGMPDAVKCAACGCHRSFHRRESDAERAPPSPHYLFSDGTPRSSRTNSGGGGRVPLLLPPHPHPHHGQKTPGFPPSSPTAGMAAFGSNNGGGGGTPTESSSEELNAELAAAAQRSAEGARKKRFRTKFTAEQKGKMLEFAERVGWRIQRQDEAAVEQFCAEAGVRRQVLKVWMHNNKHTLRKPSPPPPLPPPPSPPPPPPMS